MKPERELLLEQATACRQLAMIADASIADQLKALATEYETLAHIDEGASESRLSRRKPLN